MKKKAVLLSISAILCSVGLAYATTDISETMNSWYKSKFQKQSDVVAQATNQVLEKSLNNLSSDVSSSLIESGNLIQINKNNILGDKKNTILAHNSYYINKIQTKSEQLKNEGINELNNYGNQAINEQEQALEFEIKIILEEILSNQD